MSRKEIDRIVKDATVRYFDYMDEEMAKNLNNDDKEDMIRGLLYGEFAARYLDAVLKDVAKIQGKKE
jgi:hypothetical protein